MCKLVWIESLQSCSITNTILGIFYRPTFSSYRQFCMRFDSLLCKITREKKAFFRMGSINIYFYSASYKEYASCFLSLVLIFLLMFLEDLPHSVLH